jgi:bacteriocin biosynthesis cyclodehydratase domain-containing protein
VARVEDGLVFEHGETVLRFRGRASTQLLPLLLPLLDGTRSLRELARALGEPIAPAIEHAVVVLAQHGLLAEGVTESWPALRARTAAFCAAASRGAMDERDAAAVLAGTSTAVLGSGPLAAELVRILRASGVGNVQLLDGDEPGDVSFAIAAPEGDGMHALPRWNEAFLEATITWFQLLPFNGRFAVAGPLYVPGETACFECYRLRRGANVGYSEEFWALEQATARACSTPGFDALVAGIATTLILRWLVARDPFLPGRCFTVGLDEGLRVEPHEVLRVPRCPACSGLDGLAGVVPWAEAA